jgi:carbon-monoxide dehydrogenase large subunit
MELMRHDEPNEQAASSTNVGRSLPRVEDLRLLAGGGRYLADIASPQALHLRLVRSPEAHGVIRGIELPEDIGDAIIITAMDLPGAPLVARPRYQPGDQPMPEWPLLAYDRVRYVGEPVVAVLAESPYLAEDLADQVIIDIEPLPPTVDPSVRSDTPLHEEYPDNVLFTARAESGEPCQADPFRTVRRSFRTRRHTGVPMETRGCLASVSGSSVTIWSSTQVPHLLRALIADTMGLSEASIRVEVPDIGGAFGMKGHAFPDEALVAALAVTTGRTVRWVEDRSENLTAGIHARDHRHQLELDVDEDGHILALRAELTIDCGAYPVWPQTASLEAQMAATILPGPYRIQNYRCVSRAVATNKAPLGTYRGVARPSCAFSLERLIDEAAQELGIDPVEMRLRNLVTEFPYTSATGLEYDSGSYVESLELAHEAVRGDRTGHQAAGQTDGPHQGTDGPSMLRGVGFASFVEQSAHLPPWALPGTGVVLAPDRVEVAVDAAGQVSVEAGVTSHGQGQETTLAQIVSDRLGVPVGSVTVHCGGSSQGLYSMGTLASRSAVVAGNTAYMAAGRLAQTLSNLAAQRLGVDPGELRLQDGSVTSDTGSVAFAELAAAHPSAVDRHGHSVITAEAIYEGSSGGTFSNACHAAVVDVDPGTGQVHLRRYVVVEDCGTVINPLVVDGQIHGGVAQGIGSALYEELIYDEDGQLLTTTLMDYRLPSTMEVPDVEVLHLSSRANNSLGVKGMGESGAIGPMAAIANAVADAVGPGFASKIREVPLTPSRVWQILQDGAHE